jgi:chromosome segregation ATPase
MSNQIEIAKLHYEISQMRAQLFQTEAQLERLRAAKQALASEQASLHHHKKWGSEPELEHDAWRG